MERPLEIHTGPYKGDVSALCLLEPPGNHGYPFLLAGEVLDKYMVFSGATDGNIALWDVTDVVCEFCHKQVWPGNDKVYRPPSGRGSQGGSRWKLSRRQKAVHTKHLNAIIEVGSSLMESKSTVKASEVDEQTAEDAKEILPYLCTLKMDQAMQLNNLEASLLSDSKRIEDGLSQSKLDCVPEVDHVKEGFPYSQRVKPEFLLHRAHQSGVNSLSVSTIKGHERTWVVVSGGDDQAIHVALFTFDEKSSSSTNTRLRAVCLIETSVFSAHSSALKGVWTNGALVFSTGLDQRLRCWRLAVFTECCSLVECCQTVINVPEPAALHVEHIHRSSYRIAVVGRGLQIFEVNGA